MKSITVIIQDPAGLHARPATLLVKAASQYKSKLEIKNSSNSTANPKSIISLLSLGVKQGETIEIIADGEDEMDAITGIQKALEENNLI
ncbi:HPr family phosphocarrier protein [Mycoplasmoides alvi]|uniref:HPr family phosphocarrier protein n=1 Tax=Mycoplasmoides alvi TaxID=78580 RepID=UPI00051C8789|nr:HPr family phosphocarrier protein [Mycoplasmoides alvi]